MPTIKQFYFHLMGACELRDSEGRSLSLPTRRTALVLAMIAMEPGGWSRQRLADAVWEQTDPVAARESLRTALSALRRVLGPDAISGRDGFIGLREGLVKVVLDGEGDFMPGFENDWSIDLRLKLRAESVASACETARAAVKQGNHAEALTLIDRACRIDPLDPVASKLKVELLEEVGRKSESIAADRAYRRRVVRELGFVPPSSLPEAVPIDNPLVSAVEWAFDRDPEEALALLAATPNQWMSISVERALEVHRRVLSASKRSAPGRRRVESTAWHLAVSFGGLGDRLDTIETGYGDSIADSDFVAAGRFCDALAFGSLSCGDFKGAINFGRQGVKIARDRGDQVSVALAENTLSIIEFHCGDLEGSVRRSALAVSITEEGGTPLHIMNLRSAQIGGLIESGRFERAAERIDEYRQNLGVHGGARSLPWLLASQGLLHERMGDIRAALESYEKLAETADDAGQCAVAVADEGLMRVHSALGNDQAAAAALGRVVRYRREKRTVASPYERASAAPTLRALQERGVKLSS